MKAVNLQGVMMDNREFICNGKSMFLSDEEISKYVKERKKILEYPLGCDKQFSEQWGRCGEISFGNKIILCPNCAYEIVKKIGEEE